MPEYFEDPWLKEHNGSGLFAAYRGGVTIKRKKDFKRDMAAAIDI